ncbi:hypothetical protein F7725_011902 [Dissostichus mawsoni]|uniref:Uncharacterized protein n=1 Tax=Dissostichus mawsoni TaxID=36200 RepID=A0A7J5ZC36_DISMA|nr:hypothetical protein F7725_011902 [Dissostichus mawsoni]
MWLFFSVVPLVPPLALSFSTYSKNIVVKNCLKIWTQLKRHFGFQGIPLLSPVHSNPLFTPSITDAAFSIWEINGIVSVKQLYIDGTFAYFDQLARKFNLPKSHFFRYLQVRDSIRNRFPSFPAIPPSTWVDTLLSINPNLKVSSSPLSYTLDKGCPILCEIGKNKHCIRGSDLKFTKMWLPFLEHVKSLQLEPVPIG